MAKTITQAQFDQAVQEMKEALDLEDGEAIDSVVEEYEMQGFCLDAIIKQVGGAQALDNVPSAVSARALKAALDDNKDNDNDQGDEALACAIDDLHDKLKGGDGDGEDNQATALVASSKFDGVPSLLGAYERFAGAEEKRDPKPDCHPHKAKVLATLEVHLDGCEPARCSFAASEGPKRVMAMLVDAKGSANPSLVPPLVKVVAAAARQNEENKCNFMAYRFPEVMVDLLGDADTCGPDTVACCCQALKAIMAADDKRPIPQALEAMFGGEFKKALSMDSSGVTESLITAFRRHQGETESVVNLSGAMYRIALNDEICKKFCEGDFIVTLMTLLQCHAGHADVTHAILLLFKQLSVSDTVKSSLVESGQFVTVAAETLLPDNLDDKVVLLRVMYILTNLMLRNPAVAEHFAASLDGLKHVHEVVRKYLDTSGKLMKQVCMLVRNAAVRSAQVRGILLKMKMDERIRDIRNRHQDVCKDAAFAALRDLGVQDYN